MGIFDQDLDDEYSLEYARLYLPGQYNLFFNMRIFIYSLLHGMIRFVSLFFRTTSQIFQFFCFFIQNSNIRKWNALRPFFFFTIWLLEHDWNQTVESKVLYGSLKYFSSLVIFFIPYGAIYISSDSTGRDMNDYPLLAFTTFTALIVVVTGQIAFDTAYWTVFNHIVIWGSLLFYIALVMIFYEGPLWSLFITVCLQFLLHFANLVLQITQGRFFNWSVQH